MKQLKVKRKALHLKPDQSRVLLRPFDPGERTENIIARIMALPEKEVGRLLEEVCDEFCERHSQIHEYFQGRFDQVRGRLLTDETLSEERRELIGAHFASEFSPESAALCNPSIVPHPDQSHLPPGALRFVLSLRAIGEGHLSSLTFRSGIVYADHEIEVKSPTGYLSEPRQIPNPRYRKASFIGRLDELDLTNEITRQVMCRLEDSFSLEQLSSAIEAESTMSHDLDGAAFQMTVEAIWMLAVSNYEVHFQPDQRISERIIFPASPSQSNGIEDARFVRFHNDDGTHVYYATVTAYDGKLILPELVETSDFLHFRCSTLNGPAAQNKGMAIFPRKINGRYAMLSRQDNENIYLVFSDDVHGWHDPYKIVEPRFPWGLVQLGNCGSPIETDEGWLVLTHGVGPMRKYCIGAFLLDRDNPVEVIGRLREPLLKPSLSEREGYVPNVVYTCGSLIHNGEVIIPYGLSDYSTSFATVSLDDLLAAMQ